jgi:hypothetical protein
VATWTDVQNHLRGRYVFAEEQPNLIALDFECQGGRAQRILISAFSALNKKWLLFRSRVCERSRLDPEEALRRNSIFAVGYLALSEGFYEIVYTEQLDTLDIDELEIPLRALSDTADDLERELTGTDRW